MHCCKDIFKHRYDFVVCKQLNIWKSNLLIILHVHIADLLCCLSVFVFYKMKFFFSPCRFVGLVFLNKLCFLFKIIINETQSELKFSYEVFVIISKTRYSFKSDQIELVLTLNSLHQVNKQHK